jgi:signal transduction histidine kinase
VTSLEAQATAVPARRPGEVSDGIRRTSRYVAAILALALVYYATAKFGQSLRYTASVSAVWPPVGVGIAVLYLWGLRLWPGIFIGELLVNSELLNSLPLGSLLGQQLGNMLEIVVGAWLLRRLIGKQARLDRVAQVGGLLLALGAATAISATIGTVSMLAGGVIHFSEAAEFGRTWWLGDTAGGLVMLPLILVWAPDPVGVWRSVRSWDGGVLLAVVGALAVLAVAVDEPLTYMVFPALIWAAFRFGPPGATLATAVVAVAVIGLTAHDAGPFSSQPIDHRAVSTQLFIVVAGLTALFLSAVVSELHRSSRELADAQGGEERRAHAERQRIARDLHDSVSQALFSTALHTRAAQKALQDENVHAPEAVAQDLSAIGELTRAAQSEMRTLIFDLHGDAVAEGLVTALRTHGTRLSGSSGPAIAVRGPTHRLRLPPPVETHLYGIGCEAMANAVKHSSARSVDVRVSAWNGTVELEVRDDGTGFDLAQDRPGHFGLESMRSRAAEIEAELTIASRPGTGTIVRVEVPAGGEDGPDAPGG